MKIIVAAHGQFASGILTSLRLIAGNIDNVEAIDFIDGMSAQALKEKMKNVITNEQDVIILTDLLGGTPFKTAVELRAEHASQSIETVSGLNLAMLLEANFSRVIHTPEELAEKLTAVGKEGIVNTNQLFNNTSQVDETFEDGI